MEERGMTPPPVSEVHIVASGRAALHTHEDTQICRPWRCTRNAHLLFRTRRAQLPLPALPAHPKAFFACNPDCTLRLAPPHSRRSRFPSPRPRPCTGFPPVHASARRRAVLSVPSRRTEQSTRARPCTDRVTFHESHIQAPNMPKRKIGSIGSIGSADTEADIQKEWQCD